MVFLLLHYIINQKLKLEKLVFIILPSDLGQTLIMKIHVLIIVKYATKVYV